MKLTINDKLEIEKIISGFNEQDNERIYAEILSIVESKRHNPLYTAIRNHMPVYVSPECKSLAEESTAFQDEAHEAFWKLTEIIVKHEYALEIFKLKHAEAA